MWKGRYKELMFSDDLTKIDTDEGLKLKLFKIPSLYKYRAINCWSLENLKRDTAYFSKATDFNDPYDSALTIDKSTIFEKKNKVALLKVFCEKFNVNLSEVELVFESLDYKGTLQFFLYHYSPYKDSPELVPGIVDEFMKEDGELYNDYVSSISKLHQGKVFASCFSESELSMLMWSHYANNHSGMCIEYDFNEMDMSDEAIWGLHPVDYIEELLEFKDYAEEVSENPMLIIQPAISKSIEWSYEKEWRMIFISEQGVESFNYKISKPKSVILGARVSEEDKSEVLEIAKQKNIPVKQIQLDRSKYGLTTVEL
ncbi:DUF2971 domain-containing protein [Sporosarcina sp. ACRSM]|uniref:DUF2971 domain-containing protein n=1 Tax=Sporosarcina sp. ACRSM TaxID=2918216 RepID=UPI001EF51B8E|nr:DUF2971 domain-containing protein [Sporosarcina sp. ACRSM]MCG7336196.1 DUF2971 domain-containing protein [Sporosarcina sp. ACRSM]